MKRFLSLLMAAGVLLMMLLPSSRTAHAAESRYAVAASSDVWFFEGEDEGSKLFCLPYSYYVKILSKGEVYTAVEYLTNEGAFHKIRGYCRTDALTFVDFTPVRPYLYREITLPYTPPQTGSFGNGSFERIERTFVYYGHRYEGLQLYFYVFADGMFDFIAMDEELEYDYNTDFLEGTAAGVGKTPSALSAVEIVVICVAVGAAVLLAVFVVRGKKPASPEEMRTEF